ncbi:MAG: sigma-70 family RNA polymerase sigma factor [Planctomycetes bacterium]|nr:sigma-70 family RNA polymerase sigma factor [Planctomycetota bacterium]
MRRDQDDEIDDDARLMLAFKRGDYNAFATLVERHQKALIQFFYAQHPDRQMAEDCTQEVWRKVFKARADYEVRARFKTYLLRVARNHWIDVYRSRVKHGPLLSLDGAQEEENPGMAAAVPGAERTPLAELSGRELQEIIEEALGRLPEPQREVFVLAEFQGLRYQDVAQILDIPVGTVKSRMFNAIRRLRELLHREMD